MDLKHFIGEFQKTKLISPVFQLRLGELIITMSNNQLIYTDDQIKSLIKHLQEYLCHKHYVEYISNFKKEKQQQPENLVDKAGPSQQSVDNISNSYDNCMNLLLVVLAKIAKLSANYSTLMIDYFVDHITGHVECFNYIISFYRLYVSCQQIKVSAKEYELYNNLFEFYKKMYYISLKYENIEAQNIKDLKKLVKGNVNHINNDKKYFLDQFRLKTEATSNTSNISDNSRHMDKSPESVLMSQLRRDKTEERMKSQKSSIFNPFKNSQKTHITSKTERKVNSINSNVNISGNKSTNSDNNLKSINQKSSTEIEINIENLKKKVPNLRLPLNLMDQHFSMTRSSRRTDFSTGATSKKLLDKSNLLNLKRDSNEPILIQDKEKSMISNLNNVEEKEISPIDKLKNIAIQLGESCLATDLSCLINQKRDMELEKLAREKIGKRESVVNLISTNTRKPNEIEYIEKLKYSQKIDTDHDENKELAAGTKMRTIGEENSVQNTNSNINEMTKDFKQKLIFTFENNLDTNCDKHFKNHLKIREILSNFILSCIKEFSIEEVHLVKINFNMIYSFITLPSIDLMRKKYEKRKFDHFESDYEIDYRNVLTEGCVNLVERDGKGAFLTLEKLQSEDYKIRPNYFASRDKMTFDSLLTINDDEKGSQLSLKSEYESLIDLLILHFSSIENNLKQQNFFKQLYESSDNPEPEKFEFWCDGIRFSVKIS